VSGFIISLEFLFSVSLFIKSTLSLSKKYAKQASLSEGTKVHSFKVKAKDIQFAGDDINEFGYYPTDETIKEKWFSLHKTYDLLITYFLSIFVQKHQRASDLLF
jgi:hypothetical protein